MEKERKEKNRMKKDWFILITVINLLLLGYLIWCLIKDPKCQFKGEDITTLLGIIVSCISIVITVFFVLLAIEAYRKISEVDEAKRKADSLTQTVISTEKKIEVVIAKANSDADALAQQLSSMISSAEQKTNDQVKEFQREKGEFESLSKEMDKQYEINKEKFSTLSREMFEVLNLLTQHAVVYAEKDKNNEIRNQALTRLFRFAYKYPELLDNNIRERYLLNLSVFGDPSDIEQLDNLCCSDEESQRIKEIAKMVIPEIEKRFP